MSLIEDALKRQEELRAAASGKTAPAKPEPTVSRIQIPKPTRVSLPENPFLEAENERPKTHASVLYMPVLAIIVFLVLLFLKREFVPKETNTTDQTIDEIIPVELFTNTITEPVPTTDAQPVPVTETGSVPTTDAQPVPIAETGSVPTDDVQPVPEKKQTQAWPEFSLSGIAHGREKLAMLNSGKETLTEGETAKCGVKVLRIDTSSVTFSWNGECKTLRKGEKSDKQAEETSN